MALLKLSIAIAAFMFLACMFHISSAQNFPQDFLEVQNKARAEVGVQPLKWNDTVAAYALHYAKKRAVDCNLEHSDGPYGENIAEGGGDQFTAVDGVNLWVGEKSCYDYKSNSCVGGECLHYTQVVWRNSIHLGCARVKCRNGWWFVTCNYDPPGNYIGDRPY